MGPKTIQGSKELAAAIKTRRTELGLTIEAAAAKAGIGTKTWCRYEAGESIRKDKCRGICKALNWHTLPTRVEDDNTINIAEYRSRGAWSQDLADRFGEIAAVSFVIGSELLLDDIAQDLHELSRLPVGTHIGQIDVPLLADVLPRQFLMQYDYDFVYFLYITVKGLRDSASYQKPFMAHSVIEELALYLMVYEAQALLEEKDNIPEDYDNEWVFDLFGDCDIITCLYSDWYLPEAHCYHFKHWREEQFYCDKGTTISASANDLKNAHI